MSIFDQLQYAGGRRTPLIRQSEVSECGLACIAMVAGYYGLDTDLIALRRRFQLSLKGATLKHLLEISEQLGFSARPLRSDLGELDSLALPAILHWNLNHFVVLNRISKGVRGRRRFHIYDPAAGAHICSEEEMARRFSGAVLELIRSEQFQPNVDRVRFRISQLWSRMDGLWSSFRQIFILSAVLQICALAAPFFLQISVDTILPSGDVEFLLVLALGFGGVAMVAMLTSWVRALVLVRLGTTLSYQVTVNLFRHLLRLPLPWFARRHVGDVISRFGSVRTVMDLISQGLIAVLIDGVMAIGTLALMFVYSPALALLALAASGLALGLRLCFFSTLRHANVNMISANARENSVFIESLRGVATIKAFGEEANRQRFWQQRKAEAVNAEIKTGQLNAGFTAGEQFVMAIERVLFIYIAIRFAMSGALSLGMIFALQSYRQQFLEATSRLVQQGVSYRLLDMHLSRIADIALSQAETSASPTANAVTQRAVAGRVELRNVRFRYAANEPEILAGINLVVQPGELIGLIGPSGGGKTTLVKILMGLMEPTYGEVLIDGQALASFGVASWRRQIASVAQEDTLFAGSLADNICMFDASPDDVRIEAAAKSANIHDEIQAMPLRYHTPVGDMGSVLSGGQKQRVMLARALYREPLALFLDEATAHLDPINERAVLNLLTGLPQTRILVAHKPQTIERMDRLYLVDKGQVVALTRPS